MKKRRMKIKKNRIITGITMYMGFLFYFSAGTLAETQSKFALIMCLISVTWIFSVFHGTLLLEEEKQARNTATENVPHK